MASRWVCFPYACWWLADYGVRSLIVNPYGLLNSYIKDLTLTSAMPFMPSYTRYLFERRIRELLPEEAF